MMFVASGLHTRHPPPASRPSCSRTRDDRCDHRYRSPCNLSHPTEPQKWSCHHLHQRALLAAWKNRGSSSFHAFHRDRTDQYRGNRCSDISRELRSIFRVGIVTGKVHEVGVESTGQSRREHIARSTNTVGKFALFAHDDSPKRLVVFHIIDT